MSALSDGGRPATPAAKAPSPLRSAGAVHSGARGSALECGGNDAALASVVRRK